MARGRQLESADDSRIDIREVLTRRMNSIEAVDTLVSVCPVRQFAPTLTPGVFSTTAVFEAPAPVPGMPAVTTSRRELPPAPLPATRRPLPLEAGFEVVPTFSFVLEASDLESSGGGRDLGGAI